MDLEQFKKMQAEEIRRQEEYEAGFPKVQKEFEGKPMRTITNRLSDRLDFLFDLQYEGTPYQEWTNQRLYNKETNVIFDLTKDEVTKFFNTLY